jgi:hypothetical protein
VTVTKKKVRALDRLERLMIDERIGGEYDPGCPIRHHLD